MSYGRFLGDYATLFADGIAEGIAVNNDGLYVLTRAYSRVTKATEIRFKGDYTTAFADVNGDGRADALAVNSNGIFVRYAGVNASGDRWVRRSGVSVHSLGVRDLLRRRDR